MILNMNDKCMALFANEFLPMNSIIRLMVMNHGVAAHTKYKEAFSVFKNKK